ncbi:uncharacterized protein LOC134909014 [Pseudophryne corroboree]|uniref:uncharacterized protein LOC134909014 n=1 Tax=Pseudophryne corroboree TaxID=495146 RepID=UPI003082106D
MQHPAATIPIFDKSHLFLPLTTNPFNPIPNMDYLRCPATGHIYCLTTGILYQITAIPLSTNIQQLLQRKERDLSLLPSNPAPCTEQVSSINPINNPDPTVRCNTSSITSDDQGNKLPSIKSKTNLPPQSNSPAQSKIKSSTNPQSNPAPTTKKKKKEKKRHRKITQDKLVPTQANPAAPKTKSAAAKQSKPSVPSQVIPPKSFKIKSAPITRTILPPITEIRPASYSNRYSATTAQSKLNTRSPYNPLRNSNSKSSRFYIMALHQVTDLIRPIQNIFDHVFPEEKSAFLNLRKFPPCHISKPVKSTQLCPLSLSKHTGSAKSLKKPSLNFSREDDAMLCTFKKRVTKRKKFAQASLFIKQELYSFCN